MFRYLYFKLYHNISMDKTLTCLKTTSAKPLLCVWFGCWPMCGDFVCVLFFFSFGWSQCFFTMLIFNNSASLVWKAFSVSSLVWMHVLLGVSLSFDPLIFIPIAYLNNVKEKVGTRWFLLAMKYLFHWHLLWLPCSTLDMPTVYMWKYFSFMI